MAFRTVIVSSPTELHVRSGQLVAIQDQTFWIPTEDIAVLVLESPQVRLSSAAMSLLADQGVAVAVCDRRHMPTGILLPQCSHSRHLGVIRRQFAMTKPQKKRLWQTIVRAKIENQARCLEYLAREGADVLRGYARKVTSGDATGVEATAARYYFPRLMRGVARHSGALPDSSLDYGYAIMRAAVARALVGHGFYPAVGIHHDGQLNAFNLADDLLEPFRPFVDLLAVATGADVNEKAGRARLVAVLHQPCVIGEKTYSVLTALDDVASSLVRAVTAQTHAELHVPILTGTVRPDAVLTE